MKTLYRYTSENCHVTFYNNMSTVGWNWLDAFFIADSIHKNLYIPWYDENVFLSLSRSIISICQYQELPSHPEEIHTLLRPSKTRPYVRLGTSPWSSRRSPFLPGYRIIQGFPSRRIVFVSPITTMPALWFPCKAICRFLLSLTLVISVQNGRVELIWCTSSVFSLMCILAMSMWS